MNKQKETYFLQNFIRKSRRERLEYELNTPKKRMEGIERFCHQAPDFLAPEKIRIKDSNLENLPAFLKFVREHEESVYLLSPDPLLNEQILTLNEAVDLAAANSDAVIMIGDTFAIVFAEAEKGGRDNYLLYQK